MRVQLEYRRRADVGDPVQDRGWTRVDLAPDTEQVTLPIEWQVDETYEVRGRDVLDDGRFSEWKLQEYTVTLDDRPVILPVEVLAVSKDQCLVWAHPTAPPDLAGYRVSHLQGHLEIEASAEPAHEGLVAGPPVPLCFLPKGQRTYFVTPVAKDGREGVPAPIVTELAAFEDPLEREDFRDPLAEDFTAVTVEQGTVVPGAPTDTIEADAAGTLFWPDGEEGLPFWHDALGMAPETFWDELFLECRVLATVTPAAPDLQTVQRLTAVVAATPIGWRLAYRVDDRPFWDDEDSERFWDADNDSTFWPPFEDADPFWWMGNAEVFWETDPDGLFWGDSTWRRWTGFIANPTRQQYEIRLTMHGGFRQGLLTALSFLMTSTPEVHELLSETPGEGLVPKGRQNGTIDPAWLPGGLLEAGGRTERGALAVAATPGPTTVTFTSAFAAPPTVLVGIEDVGGDEFAWQFTAGGPTRTGFSVRVYDAAGVEEFTGRIHWLAVGA